MEVRLSNDSDPTTRPSGCDHCGSRVRISTLDLLPNPDEEAAAAAVVVAAAAGPKPNAVDAVVLGPNEPNENPDVSSQEHRECRECKAS